MATTFLLVFLPRVVALIWTSFVYYRYRGRFLPVLVAMSAAGVAAPLLAPETPEALDERHFLLVAFVFVCLGAIHHLCAQTQRNEEALRKTRGKLRRQTKKVAEVESALQGRHVESAESEPTGFRETDARGGSTKPIEGEMRQTRGGDASLGAEIIERKRAEDILAGYNRILEKWALGADLKEILDGLAFVVERRIPDSRCLILGRHANGQLRLEAAPSMPDEFVGDAERFLPQLFDDPDARDGIAPGRVSIGRRTTPEDGESRAGAGPAGDAAFRFNIRSGWIDPILSSDGKPIGALAVLFGEPREPIGRESAIAKESVSLAGLAIEQHATRKSLQESEERFRKLVETANVVPWEYDLVNRRLLYIGPQIGQRLGYPKEKWLEARFWREIVHDDDVERLVREVEEAAKAKTSHDVEFRVLAADGRVLWFRDIGSVVVGEQGPVELRGFSVDITAQKRAERERIALETRIQDAQKVESLSVLAGGVAHDFNNLLVSIVGSADMALGDLPRDSPARVWIEEIQNGGRRAAELTEQMLAYTGRVRIEATIVDLADLVREMARLLTTTISKKIRLSYDGPQALATAEVDATQVRQVVMNLITNAAEAIGDKEGLVRITTGVMEADAAYLEDDYSGGEDLTPGRFTWLEVSDNGRGMHQDTQARIFDPFFTTKFTGRGLGLAALLGIVRQHGGTVKVQSQVGVGSTLRVLFPFAEISTNSAEVELPVIDTRGGLLGRGCSILIADDEKGARMVAAAILRQAGFSVSTARDGHETVASFERGRDRFALVLLDMKMPGLGGEEVVPKLRAIRPDIPVLICSGYTEDETKDRFLRDDVEGFLAKPYRRDELINAVQRVLETARSNASAAGV